MKFFRIYDLILLNILFILKIKLKIENLTFKNIFQLFNNNNNYKMYDLFKVIFLTSIIIKMKKNKLNL